MIDFSSFQGAQESWPTLMGSAIVLVCAFAMMWLTSNRPAMTYVPPGFCSDGWAHKGVRLAASLAYLAQMIAQLVFIAAALKEPLVPSAVGDIEGQQDFAIMLAKSVGAVNFFHMLGCMWAKDEREGIGSAG